MAEEEEAQEHTVVLGSDNRPGDSAPPDGLIGKRIAESYEIVSLIAEGGMGSVYLGRNIFVSGSLYAIKILRDCHDQQSMLRFVREAETIDSLKHPNIVGFHSFGTGPDGTAYLIVDYLKGQTLADLLAKQGAMSVERAIGIFSQICEALSYAHKKGVIHRDLKPSNIMLVIGDEGTEQVKLLDFGIAKSLESRSGVELTRTGETLGSPLYMSPEQCQGQSLDARSDIYALGCVLYECLSGRPPLAGDNVYDTIYKQMNALPEGLSEIKDRNLRQSLEAVVFRAVSKNPDSRYGSVEAFKQDLQTACARKGILSSIASPWRLALLKISPERRRRWMLQTLGALAVISLVSIGGVALLAGHWLDGAFKNLEVWDVAPLRGYTAIAGEADLSGARSDEPIDSIVTDRIAAVTVMMHRLRSLPKNSPDRVKLGLRLGRYCRDRLEFQEAARFFQEAYDTAQALPAIRDLPTGKRKLAYIALMLADCYYYLRSYSQAEQLYLEGLSTAESILPDTHPHALGEFYFKLGDILLSEKKFEPAVARFDTALACWRTDELEKFLHGKDGGSGNSALLDRAGLALAKQGEALRHLKDFSRSSQSLAKAQIIWTKLKGASSNDTAAVMGLSGLVKWDEASMEAVLDKARLQREGETLVAGGEEMIQRSPDPDREMLVFLLANHCLMLKRQWRYLESVPLLIKYYSLKPSSRTERNSRTGNDRRSDTLRS